SPDGRRAALLGLLPSTLTIVDTDESSPTFLQNLVTAVPIPVNQPSALDIDTQVRLTPDDRYALILLQLPGATPGELARFDLLTGAFVDHDLTTAGIDNIGPQSLPPVLFGGAPHGFSLAQSGRFAVIAGFSGCGWIGRLDLDPYDPNVFTWTPWSPAAPLQNAWSASLSADETEVGIGSWQSSQCSTATSPMLVRLDAGTGLVLGTTNIPQNSNSATLQNLYTVAYR
ncbi:MAG: hypothetical protein KDC98_04025, partial [Planctomycetes bacterium]|nr:hypothetical protein [Planctomycetota bacterium]